MKDDLQAKGRPSGSGPSLTPGRRSPTWPQAGHRHSCPQAPSPLCSVSNLEGGGLTLRSRRLAGHLAPFGTAALIPAHHSTGHLLCQTLPGPPSSLGQKTCCRHQILRRNSSGSHLPSPLMSSPSSRVSVPVLPLGPLSVFFPHSFPCPLSSSLYEIFA